MLLLHFFIWFRYSYVIDFTIAPKYIYIYIKLKEKILSIDVFNLIVGLFNRLVLMIKKIVLLMVLILTIN